MPELEGSDQVGNPSSLEEQFGFNPNPPGQLSGGTKPDAPKPASGGKGTGKTVNPRRAWTTEQRARASSAFWERKRAKAAGEEGSPESILEVKGEPKEKEKPAPQPTKADVEGWAGLIYFGHVLVAKMSKIPELELDKNQSMELSSASMNVMRHYGSAILSEKSQDWIKLGMIMCVIYPPKLQAAKARAMAARAAKAAAVPNQGAGGFEKPSEPPEFVQAPITPGPDIDLGNGVWSNTGDSE